MEIPESAFAALTAELIRKRIPINKDRYDAGAGRSQAFGVIRRWSYRPHLSRNTWMRPELWALLLDFAEKYVTVAWDAVTVNDSYLSAKHRDKGNEGESMTVSFGDFIGGELCMDISGETVLVDTRHRGVLFNGSQITHWTAPFEGRRFCLVFYKIKWPPKFLPRYKLECSMVEDGMRVFDEYDMSIVVLNTKGHVVRVIEKGIWREWIGRLTSRSQPSRAPLPTVVESAGLESGSLVSQPSQATDTILPDSE
jgi:hypothetical protein